MDKEEGGDQLRADFVVELINPEVSYGPLGKDDGLSVYLYRPMQIEHSADTMIAFIDAVEPFIDKGQIDEEGNNLKLLRMMSLVGDIPADVPEDERLRAWEHMLSADWVNMHAHPGDLETMIRRLTKENPAFGTRITDLVHRLIAKKSELFESSVGFSDDVPRVGPDDFDFLAYADGYTYLRNTGSEFRPLYHSLVVLSITVRGLTF